MCENAVTEEHFTIDYVPDCYETLQMYKKDVSRYIYMLKYCLEKYKTEEIGEKPVFKDIFIVHINI